MPTYTMSDGFFEEYDIPFDPEEFTRTPEGDWAAYSAVEDTSLNAQELTETGRKAYRALVESGAVEIVCRYDGGYDEGFAYFEFAIWDDQRLGSEELAQKWADGPLGEKPTTAFIHYSPDMEARLTRTDRVKNALEEFAYAMASQILGRSFGTGEAGIQGQLSLNLKSGIIKDVPPEENE